MVLVWVLMLIACYQGCTSQSVPLRGPPVVERVPILLNSFLPASMQIIAHLTDLMKYDVKPAPGGATTTSTVRPTSPHKPGIYSPKNPPGPAAYFARGTSYQEYVQRLQNPEGFGYFDRYRYPVVQNEDHRAFGGLEKDSVHDFHGRETERARLLRPAASINTLPQDLNLFGQAPSDLLQQVNRLEDYDFEDEDVRVHKFAENYDDIEGRNYIIGNKKTPPTKAYVTLLSLYDLLNKESKKLQLSKYGGFTNDVLNVLAETSLGTSSDQLRIVLKKVAERRDTKDQSIISKINTLVQDLETSGSYINDALKPIPSLQYLL